MVAQCSLEALVMVRIHVGQPLFLLFRFLNREIIIRLSNARQLSGLVPVFRQHTDVKFVVR